MTTTNEIRIHDVRQGSDEWHELRCGKITGTSSASLLVNGKSDNGLGAGAIKLLHQKIAERVTGPNIDENFVSFSMLRGQKLEPFGRDAYEEETFTEVQQVGFISLGPFYGCSPDGLIGEDGGIEIKCPEGPEFVRYLLTGEIDKKHIIQMQWCLFVTGRDWWDYVVFHPDFPQELIIKRVERDEAMQRDFADKGEVWCAEMVKAIEKLGIE